MVGVSLRSVFKTYDSGVDAVHDVSLDIAQGEFVVLVGPSGCGKSTTLRMIAGLEDISKGSIAIAGRVVNEVHPKDRNIAMVFQNYALYPHMTVYQNMAFALKLRHTPAAEIDRRVRAAADILGLGDYLARKPKALSGGQRQRVAVGRAIVREPEVFLFDEPLSNLDAKLRVSTRAELKGLQQRLRTTTVYVTHDQEEAMTLGDRIVVMAAGRIQQVGTPLEVFNRPINRFVAAFIGTPPTNFIPGHIRRAEDRIAFVESSAATPQGSAAAPLTLPLGPIDAADGAPVLLGIRPQAVKIHPTTAPCPLHAIDARVHLVEPLGEQVDLRVHTGLGHAAVFRVPALPSIAPGERIIIEADPARVQVFEPGEFGRCLTA